MQVEFSLPAWDDRGPPECGTPRSVRNAVRCEAVHVDTGPKGRAERGYGERRKKGKPLDKRPIRRELLHNSQTKIVVTGPDYVGCTTLLQQLGHAGYPVDTSLHKPEAADRLTFSQQHFDEQVARWKLLQASSGPVLVEDSPWAYYHRHVHHLPTSTRTTCQATLSSLTLPDVTIALHTSGVTVGRRHPLWHTSPEQYSPHALQ